MKLSGASLDAVALRFEGVHRDALFRHMKHHIDEDERKALIDDLPMKELAARAAEEGGSVLDHLTVVRNVVMRALLAAAESSDRAGTATLAGRATEVLQVLGKISGELSSLMHVTNTTNNIAVFRAPDFLRLESMLVERLAPWPEALASVVDGLRELEGRPPIEGPTVPVAKPLAAIEHRGAH